MTEKILTEFKKRIDEHSEDFNKEVESIKSISTYQTEMAELNIMFELKKKKITLERFNSRLDKAEGHISKLKDRAMGLTQKEHMSVHTHTHTHADTFWGNIKWNNICIIWVPEGRKRRVENLLEEIWQNIPNLEKKTDIKVQEAQRIQNKMNLKNSAIRHNIIKISKVKEF